MVPSSSNSCDRLERGFYSTHVQLQNLRLIFRRVLMNRIHWNTLTERTFVLAAIALIATSSALAQGNAALKEKLAAVKQSMAANKQKLSQYQWVESTQLTLKGDSKGITQNSCQYGPD